MSTTNHEESNKRKRASEFEPQKDWRIISQGAEARIWKIPANSSVSPHPSIAKERFSKSYRHPALDERLTKQRCRAEGRILTKCLEKGGLDVPKVLRIEAAVLYLEFIRGKTLRDTLEELMDQSDEETANDFATKMGVVVAKVHNLGVVHGDLTTSNMMLRDPVEEAKESDSEGDKNITLIDFGLAKNTDSAEERAVDLYVLERALLSTHPRLPQDFWNRVMKGYEDACTSKTSATLNRLEQVRQRGRKRECFG